MSEWIFDAVGLLFAVGCPFGSRGWALSLQAPDLGGEVSSFGEAACDSILRRRILRLLAVALAKGLVEAQQLRVVGEWARELKVHDAHARRGEGRKLKSGEGFDKALGDRYASSKVR